MGLALADRHLGLGDDRAAVDDSGHAVNRAPGDLRARAQRLADRVKPGEARQEARVEVDDAALERAEEPGLEHAHESRQHDQVRPGPGDGGDEPRLTLALELGPEGGRVDERGRHAEAGAEREDPGVGYVREDADDPRAAEPARGLGGQDGLRVGAAARA